MSSKIPSLLEAIIFGTGVGQLGMALFGGYNTVVVQTSVESVPFLVTFVKLLDDTDFDINKKAATLLCGLALETIFVGIIATTLSYLHLGKILHYLPGPVSSGAFAVIGYFLYTYSYTVAVGEEISSDCFKNHAYYLFIMLNVSGVILFLLQTLRPRPYNFPVFLVVGTIIFHLVLLASGTSIKSAQNLEWLMEPPKTGAFYHFYETINPGKANFSWLFSNCLNLFLASLMGPILNSGINIIVIDKLFQGRSNLDSLFKVYFN